MSQRKDKAPHFLLTAREEETMKALWSVDKSLSASEIADMIPNRSWPASSIQGVLRSLEKKKAVHVTEITKLGKSYGRLFSPTLSANDYVAMQFERYYQSEKIDAFSLLSAVIGKSNFSKDDVEKALKDLLDNY